MAAVGEHHHQSLYLSVFAGVYLLEDEVYGGYKTPPRAKRQSTYGRLEAVHGAVYHTHKSLLKIEILFPDASAFLWQECAIFIDNYAMTLSEKEALCK